MFLSKKEAKARLAEAEAQKGKIADYETQLDALTENLSQADLAADQIQKSAKEMERDLTSVADDVRDVQLRAEQIREPLDDLDATAEMLTDEVHQVGEKVLSSNEWQTSQAEQIFELQDKSKHYTKVAKLVSENITQGKTMTDGLHTLAEEFSSAAASVGVLALQSAIDAGRLGEEGTAYIQTAEQIRDLANGASQNAKDFAEQLKNLSEAVDVIQTNFDQFVALLKENNTMLAQMSAAASENEKEQKADLDDIGQLLETFEESLGAVRSQTAEIAGIQDKILAEMEDVGASYMEQQNSISDLGESIEQMRQISDSKNLGGESQ